MKEERLQKFLANKGLGSRREIEKWIEEGRIFVNGETATLGCKIKGKERIVIDGKLLHFDDSEIQTQVLLYNKPDGEICSMRDPEGRPSVFRRLPKLANGRWIMIGRLDITTCGLLLFTTNGELAHRLMHPSFEIIREYAVRVKGDVNQEVLDNLKKGVDLEDGFAKFDTIVDAGGEGSNHWYHVTLREGRNREVRRLWESQNLTVSRLIRIRFGDVLLPRHLPRGKTEFLTDAQVRSLLEKVNLGDQD